MIVHEGNLNGAGIRLGIVAARFNETVVRTLVNGAIDVARRAGVGDDAIELAWVPGAFEIPVVAAALAASGRVDTGVPMIFGVLTTDTAEQAEARAGGKAGNKGADAALAAIETVNVLRSLRA